MDLDTALNWAAGGRTAVLITLRRDGRPQSSDVAYTVKDGRFLVSLTASRAKTANMQRDNRVIVHLTDPGSYTYLSFDCTAELSPVASEPSDETADALVEYYQAVAGEHPDWDEYRQAMVDEGRLIATISPKSVVGQIN
ncbi:MAG: PPOX class F420-dependent oxidoreductase [Acidimicrobiales bacterium]